MSYPYPFSNTDGRSYLVAGGYCSPEDVEGLFKNIASYSQLDVDEINRRIADATVEIDATINLDYVVPLTDATGLVVLRLICSRLAAAVIHETYEMSEEPSTNPQRWREWAERMLKRIQDGDILFTNAALQPDGSLPQVPAGKGATFNPDDDALLNSDKEPLFQRDGRGNLSSLGDLI